MGRSNHITAVAVAFLIVLVVGAWANPVESRDQVFYAGTWVGYKSFDDATGAFSSCYVSAERNTNESIGFVILSDSSFYLVVINVSWFLDENVDYDVSLYIDRSFLGDFTASTLDMRESVFIRMPYERDVLYQLEHGSLLSIQTGQTTLSYSLDGSLNALGALDDCWVDEYAGSIGSNPFAGGHNTRNPFGGGTSSSESIPQTSEYAEIVESILSSAGLYGYDYVYPSERIDVFQDYEFFWSNGNVYGVLSAADKSDDGFSAWTSSLIIALEDMVCTDQFLYGVSRKDLPSGNATKRVLGNCVGAEDQVAMTLSFIEASEYNIVIWHLAVSDFASEVAKADEKVFEYLSELLL